MNERMECERTSVVVELCSHGRMLWAVEIQGVEDERDSNHKPPDERPACRIVSNHVTNHHSTLSELDIYKTYKTCVCTCPTPKWNEGYLSRGSLKLSLQKEKDDSLSPLGICAQVVTQSTNYHSPSSL